MNLLDPCYANNDICCAVSFVCALFPEYGNKGFMKIQVFCLLLCRYVQRSLTKLSGFVCALSWPLFCGKTQGSCINCCTELINPSY